MGIDKGIRGAKKKHVAMNEKYLDKFFAASIVGPSQSKLASCYVSIERPPFSFSNHIIIFLNCCHTLTRYSKGSEIDISIISRVAS